MITDITHWHAFCGAGSGAAGFNDAAPSIPGMQGRMVCLGGVDSDRAAIADFTRLAGVPGTVLDLFARQQYLAFHGRQPSAAWREATTSDLHASAQHRSPNVVFLSAPCKGFSGLLSQTMSITAKYVALNELTLRGVWLMLEAWADDPPSIILFENVPRIATRGRYLLDQIVALLRHYGYAVSETTHDCGELGGLAQSRKRFLLVARLVAKVRPFLYEPPKRPLRGVGEILGRMQLPGDPAAGPMHRVPNLAWKTWVRLAFVEAGSDWRSLNKLAVENGHLRDYLITPAAQGGYLGVREWDQPAGTITSRGTPSCGAFSIADPRAAAGALQYQQHGVLPWDKSAGAVIGVKSPGQGTFSVADPRHTGPAKHSNEFRIVRFQEPARSVTGAHGTGQCVADPRGDQGFSKYAVTGWSESSRTVISGSTTGQGAFAVADPRSGLSRAAGDAYLTAGHYGVANWDDTSNAVSASACHDNGVWSVADPRAGSSGGSSARIDVPALPSADDKLVCRIVARDGTWHRPFTTLELAALQSMYDPDDYSEAGRDPFMLHGASDSAHRERIGNAVPRKAAQAMGEEIGRTILLARSGGEAFQLSSTPVWVRPLAVALSVAGAA